MNSIEDSFQDLSDDEDEEKTNRIFSAAARQNIEELKSLLNSPKWYTVEDEDGFSVLEKAIMLENKAVFDFLLSIEDFRLVHMNLERRSPLVIALNEWNEENDEDLSEYYAIELINKGFNVHVTDFADNTFLHLAVESEYLEVCRLLIEKGVDVNAENYWGDTPLQILFDGALRRYTDEQTLLDFLYMFLYYNADLSPPSKPSLDVQIFEFCLLIEIEDDYIQEIIFNYTVDEYSECEVDAVALFYFMSEGKNTDLAYKIMNHLSDMKASRLLDCAAELFLINSNYVKALLNKFDYFVGDILWFCLMHGYTEPYFNTESLATIIVLLESDFSDDIVRCINYWGISGIIKGYFDLKKSEYPIAPIKELIYYLLPYFKVVSSRDLNAVYRKFGYCDLFKVLLHMDIDVDQRLYDAMPGAIFDVRFDLDDYLDGHVVLGDESNEDSFEKRNGKDFRPGCTAEGVEKLLEYFADQTIKDFCYEQDNEKLTVKAVLLPQVPLLQQLARDSCRKFLVERYNITNSMQFYTILNWLPISPVHKKIISYETPLY